jgi:hypothetical protein
MNKFETATTVQSQQDTHWNPEIRADEIPNTKFQILSKAQTPMPKPFTWVRALRFGF